MGNAWATVADIRDEQLPDADDFLQGIANTNDYLLKAITDASDLARTKLARYRYFFDGWTAATVPAIVRNHVVAIAIHQITSRPTKLARNTLEKTTWERNRDFAVAELEKIGKSEDSLDVVWPTQQGTVTGGHRVVMAMGRPHLG